MTPGYAYRVSDAQVLADVNGSSILTGRLVWPVEIGGFALDSLARDLLRVAAAVLAADRLSPRRPPALRGDERRLAWRRLIELELSVENPDQWRGSVGLLSCLLSFMTDDDWSVSFVAEPSRAEQMPMFRHGTAPSAVALFSGGLDSAAGLLVASRAQEGATLAVSSYANDVRLDAQRRAVKRADELGARVQWAPVCTRLEGARRTRSSFEQTQRSRALMFLALGAAAAIRRRSPLIRRL